MVVSGNLQCLGFDWLLLRYCNARIDCILQKEIVHTRELETCLLLRDLDIDFNIAFLLQFMFVCVLRIIVEALAGVSSPRRGSHIECRLRSSNISSALRASQ